MAVFDYQVDQVSQELARRLRSALPLEAIAVIITDDGWSGMRTALAVGYEEESGPLLDRLRAQARETAAAGRVLMHRTPRGQELTATMVAAHGVVGAITVLLDDVDAAARLADAERELAAIAEDGATALEHARALRQVQRRAQRVAEGELLTGIAHELRNPLFGISSAAQLLRFRAREDPVLERNIGRILREVERLNGMVSDLIEYGGVRAPTLAEGDPDRVWDDVLHAHRGVIESRSLVVQRSRPERPITCDLDAEQLGHAFVALLAFAAESAPAGTDLTLRSAMRSGGWRCTLTHSGPPLPDEERRRAFDIFSPVRHGRGVALALARRILEEHGGTVALEGSPERGSEIVITLPLTRRPRDVRQPAGAAPSVAD